MNQAEMKLECPICRDCHTVTEWNEALGRRDEPIPTDIKVDDWQRYAVDHMGVIDCPSCGGVAIYEDMMAV